MNYNGNQMTIVKLNTCDRRHRWVINLTYARPPPTERTRRNDPLGLTTTATSCPSRPSPAHYGSVLRDHRRLCRRTQLRGYNVNGSNQLMRTTSRGVDPTSLRTISSVLKWAPRLTVQAAERRAALRIATTRTTYRLRRLPGYSNQYTMIRSMRVSLIGRTQPGQFTGDSFRNNFDGGQYRIQALSLIINPRNLSMND